MKAITYQDPDTGIMCIIHTAECVSPESGQFGSLASHPDWTPLTEDEQIAIAEKAVPTGLSFQVIDRTEIPTDRAYRDAWVAGFNVDVAKAKEEALIRLRAKRDKLMLKLDKDEQLASRKGLDLTAIYAEKDSLCACTDGIKNLSHSSELMTINEAASIIYPLEVLV